MFLSLLFLNFKIIILIILFKLFLIVLLLSLLFWTICRYKTTLISLIKYIVRKKYSKLISSNPRALWHIINVSSLNLVLKLHEVNLLVF